MASRLPPKIHTHTRTRHFVTHTHTHTHTHTENYELRIVNPITPKDSSKVEHSDLITLCPKLKFLIVWFFFLAVLFSSIPFPFLFLLFVCKFLYVYFLCMSVFLCVNFSMYIFCVCLSVLSSVCVRVRASNSVAKNYCADWDRRNVFSYMTRSIQVSRLESVCALSIGLWCVL